MNAAMAGWKSDVCPVCVMDRRIRELERKQRGE